MASRYRGLMLYSLGLAVAAVTWVGLELTGRVAFPPWWAMLLCVAACLLVFQFGVRAPRVGLISMERVPQIGMLLILPPSVAATLCGVASLLWPLVNRRYSQGSLTVGFLRGLHNAGMTIFMVLLAAQTYRALGGQAPLVAIRSSDIGPLFAMALVAQVVNISLMILFYKLDGREVRSVVTPSYALSDLIFVPAGVLAAVLFNSAAASTFVLFVVLMAVFVLSFNAIGHGSSATSLERSPLARMFQARRALQGARSIDALGERLLSEVRALFRYDEFYLALTDRQRGILEVRVHERGGQRMPRRDKSLAVGVFGWVVEQRESILVSDWDRAPEGLRLRAEITDQETSSIIAVPLMNSGTAVGLLSVQSGKAGLYSEADLHLLERLAEEVTVAVSDARAFEDAEEYRQRLEQRVAERTEELEKANREKERLIGALRERSLTLERESQEDPLTGVANRRHFMQRLLAEFEVATAVGQPLTVAIADLDYFKIVNDSLGHRVGDDVLRRCAELMSRLNRESDLLARIGGEEFAFILPNTSCDSAVRQCECVRDAIESFDWSSIHAKLKLTISIGLWQWDGRATVSELLQSADSQLYEAKRGGRNRVAGEGKR